MKININKQSGFSLIELMVSIAISIFLLGAIFSFFVGNLSTQKNTIKELSLNRELRLSTDLFTSELRRAGYYPAPSATFPTTAQISAVTTAGINPSNSCILFSAYNLLATPTLEASGFRYISGTRTINGVADTAVNVLQIRIDATGKCNATSDDINSTKWEDITDPTVIKINSFSVQSDSNDPAKINISYEAETIVNSKNSASTKANIKANNLSIYTPNITTIKSLSASE